jgi:hypothetical protein
MNPHACTNMTGALDDCDRVRVDTLPASMYPCINIEHGLHVVRCMCGELFAHAQDKVRHRSEHLVEPNGQENITSIQVPAIYSNPIAKNQFEVIIVRVGLGHEPDRQAVAVHSDEGRGKKSRNHDASSTMPVVKSYRRRVSIPAVTEGKTKGKFILHKTKKEREEKSSVREARKPRHQDNQ